jgi:hypothetical protein
MSLGMAFQACWRMEKRLPAALHGLEALTSETEQVFSDD